VKQVLVVDDKPVTREMIRTMLECSGYDVSEATDGEEAVRIAQQIVPDAILLDLQMPALDGFGALERLRADPRFVGIPIIALTASAMRGDREKALAAGFTSYLSKPVMLRTLQEELARLLR
jgi:two-component system cell cycle response regulator DivK